MGVNTDHLTDETVSLDAVADAYLDNSQFAEDAGAGAVLMASRHLARAAQSADDYRRVYDRVLLGRAVAGRPALARHGVRPGLEGYFGRPTSPTARTRCCAS